MTRCRRGGAGFLRARVERFAEPALLVLLRDRPAHGYELLEELERLAPDPERCRNSVMNFSEERFLDQIDGVLRVERALARAAVDTGRE